MFIVLVRLLRETVLEVTLVLRFLRIKSQNLLGQQARKDVAVVIVTTTASLSTSARLQPRTGLAADDDTNRRTGPRRWWRQLWPDRRHRNNVSVLLYTNISVILNKRVVVE